MNAFVKTAMIATLITYFLIFVGGLVRVSGAGLGCPDWPRCYGSWIPPLNEQHLQQLKMTAPDGSRAAEVLTEINPATFNFTLAWIEYGNRLVGVCVGIAMLVLAGMALCKVRRDWPLLLGSLAALALTIFNGWLGAVVVASELHQLIVSLHMGAALLTISILVYVTIAASYRGREPGERHGRLRLGFLLVWLVGMVQIANGAWMRGALEELEQLMPLAGHIAHMDALGGLKYAHIVLGLLVSLAGMWLAIVALSKPIDTLCRGAAQATLVLSVLQIVIGFSFRPLGLWPILQVTHLWLASLWIGAVLVLIIGLRYRPAEAADSLRTGRWLALGVGACLVVALAGGLVIGMAERSRQLPIEFAPADFALPTAKGHAFAVDDLQGRITVLNFMFSRCPAYCPGMNARMAALYRDFDDPAKVQFISITLDPTFDTPEVMRDYAEAFGVSDRRWQFLTGPLDDAKAAARAFFVPEDYAYHETDLILLDPEGRVRGFYAYDSNLRMRELREDIQHLAREYFQP